MNLEAGGEAVLLTFARGGSEAHAFDSLVNGELLRFTAAGSGKMTDRSTGSTWDAITGDCLWGAMKGAHLTERFDGVPCLRLRTTADSSEKPVTS